MANAKHLAHLKQGLKSWNQWRTQKRTLTPDLRGADLDFAVLPGANFSGVLLQRARLQYARLQCADLRGADLRDADLHGADLWQANLHGADLGFTRFQSSSLLFTNLEQSRLNNTVLADVDLSRALALETIDHIGPSTIGLDTLYKSQGNIPDGFLRDAGVDEDVINHLLPLIRSGPPIQWHSSFISYSTKDEEFARLLHSRMRAANLRVWYAPEDLKGGKKLHEQLFDAIQIQDKLLLILSEQSLESEWVRTEIRKAREVERKEKRRKLFPIRLSDFDTLRNWTCFDADSGKDLAIELREYYIPDFSKWKDHDAFEASFKRLHDALKA